MKLLLRKPIPGDDWDRLIAWVCGPYCHAEILFDDGRMFSSLPPNGVRFLSAVDVSIELENHATYWNSIALPWATTPEILHWCDTIAGDRCGYDYRGAFASGFGLATENPEKWFCSEISAEIISRASGEKIPTLLCPTALGVWVDGLLAGESRETLVAMVKLRQAPLFTLNGIALPLSCREIVDSIMNESLIT